MVVDNHDRDISKRSVLTGTSFPQNMFSWICQDIPIFSFLAIFIAPKHCHVLSLVHTNHWGTVQIKAGSFEILHTFPQVKSLAECSILGNQVLLGEVRRAMGWRYHPYNHTCFAGVSDVPPVPGEVPEYLTGQPGLKANIGSTEGWLMISWTHNTQNIFAKRPK